MVVRSASASVLQAQTSLGLDPEDQGEDSKGAGQEHEQEEELGAGRTGFYGYSLFYQRAHSAG